MLPETEPYIALKDAAEYLHMQDQDLRRKSRLGLIPCHIVGGTVRHRYRYRKSELDAWLQTTQRKGPETAVPKNPQGRLARVV